MPVALSMIRDQLMPGLWELSASTRPLAYSMMQTKEIFAANILDQAALPAVSLPVAVAMGVAAAVMKNPVVTRRFLP